MKTESSKTTPSSNISATYICYTNNCNRKFTKLADMYDHEEQEHDKKRKYNCGECKKRFFENNHLNDHNKAVHNIISETPMTPTIEKKDQEKRKIAKATSVSEKESDTEDKNDDNRYFTYLFFYKKSALKKRLYYDNFYLFISVASLPTTPKKTMLPLKKLKPSATIVTKLLSLKTTTVYVTNVTKNCHLF